MTSEQDYYTIKSEERVSHAVHKSRFIASMAPRSDIKSVREYIEKVKTDFPDATHHAYAYRLLDENSTSEKFYDANEPAGTAGRPMLAVLQANNLHNVVVVASRYYGGIKLGHGGLTRAYRLCAALALEQADCIKKEPMVRYIFTISYEQLGDLKHLLTVNKIDPGNIVYDENIMVDTVFPLKREKEIIKGFQSLTRGSGNYRKA